MANTYRVRLRYELFRGRLSEAECQASKLHLSELIRTREAARSGLAELARSDAPSSSYRAHGRSLRILQLIPRFS